MKTKNAEDIMTRPVVTATEDMRLTDAIKLLLRHHVSGLPVVDAQENLVGIITEHDIMNFALSGNAADTTVGEAMTKDVVTFPPEAGLVEIVECLSARRMRRVPVVVGRKVVGIVSRRDVLREMLFMYSRY